MSHTTHSIAFSTDEPSRLLFPVVSLNTIYVKLYNKMNRPLLSLKI